jgi:hypothetical protein
MTMAGMSPDQWQADLLRSSHDQLLLLCSRQSGKSQTAATLAVLTAILQPGSLTLLLSPSLRQSGELFRDKVMRVYDAAGRPVKASQATALQLTLANGSRIVSLPGEEQNIRGYSGVSLLVVDEAARVPDALYCSFRPMLAVSHGRLVALSTPFGRRGWFYDEWTGSRNWHRVRITADQCPRISSTFLAEERAALGERWYLQEYHCEFMDMIGAVFSGADIDAAMASNVQPLEFPT